MTAVPIGVPRFFVRDPDDDTPLVGGKVYFYIPGTTTAKAIYTDSAKSAEHANPVILEADGGENIYIEGEYDVAIYRSDDTLVVEIDNVTSDPSSTGSGLASSEVEYAANHTIDSTESGLKIIGNNPAGFTFAFDPAANLGTDFWCVVFNEGMGAIVLDPNASETINEVSTITLYAGESAIVWSNGTKLRAMVSTFNLALRINAATGKTTPVDADLFGIVDSAASNVLKKLTWGNLKATLWTALGALIAGGTAKAAPVAADTVAISDSEASNATKKATLPALLEPLVSSDLGWTPAEQAQARANVGFALSPSGIDDDDVTAGVLTYPADGNAFISTNTETVTSMATVAVGVTMRHNHTSSHTFTHHATDLICPHGIDLVVNAGDITEWEEYAAGDYRCVRVLRGGANRDGWDVIYHGSLAAAASHEFGDLSAYRRIKMVGRALPSTNATTCVLQFSSDNGSSYDTTSSNYYGLGSLATESGSLVLLESTYSGVPASTSNISNTLGTYFEFMIQEFNQASVSLVHCSTYQRDSANTGRFASFSLEYKGTSALDAFRFIAGSGDTALTDLMIEGTR